MKAIAVFPGRPGSVHLEDVPRPALGQDPEGQDVLVKVLSVGVDATDWEINQGHYGEAPPGSDFLILGHESLGRVEAVGPAVQGLAPGDLVVAMVRREGGSFYDRLGRPDLTTEQVYWEHGISRVHGFLTEYFVEDARALVRVPPALQAVGVLLEPLSIVEKGIEQAYAAQSRLGVWRPCRAAVMGAGSIGLLASLVLRLRGLEVHTFARARRPSPNAEQVEALGAHYHAVADLPLREAAGRLGPFDLILEATGASSVAFEAMEALGKNGVLVLTSVTGGDQQLSVPADAINLGFVLGNKAMVGTVNAARQHFEAGVRDLAAAEGLYPGWLGGMITHRVTGLERFEALFSLLDAKGPIKVVMDVE